MNEVEWKKFVLIELNACLNNNAFSLEQKEIIKTDIAKTKMKLNQLKQMRKVIPNNEPFEDKYNEDYFNDTD